MSKRNYLCGTPEAIGAFCGPVTFSARSNIPQCGSVGRLILSPDSVHRCVGILSGQGGSRWV
jgi:hypothetical protein